MSGMSGHGKRSEELLTAARGGNTNAVRALMAFGVDVNARDEFGRAALHIASRNGCEVLVGLLLEGVGSQRADINATDKFGRTALHEGAREGHEAVVRLLLNGIGGQLPDMNAVDRLGRTPFHEAEGHTTVEQLLMKAASGAGSTGNQVH